MISIIGQLGDLVASKIKRVYNERLWNIFPGHGGVLDRFDSAMFAGMFFNYRINISNNFIGWF